MHSPIDLGSDLTFHRGATFINLHMSTLSQKWFGESERLVDAVFSLAHKLQPAIIFIDEIDSFLRERTAADHEVLRTFPSYVSERDTDHVEGDGEYEGRIHDTLGWADD